ncbi:MAG: hypothetical protein CVV27_06650 [Candidatus Melainabacteria bacterium HGW-Melainabacteria-1]|nr:MAG: hypothetical protein CVV27_06650 [Candidatus Melainabacteria bacterium HGW-Melainabacteria-1]
MPGINLFLLGAISLASFMAGLFFFRFWKTTQDRLFLLFGLAFVIEGFNRAALALISNPKEGDPFFYIIRLLAFSLILGAILDKNLSQR